MENQRNNFLMSMNMPDEVYDYNIPIFIRQDRSDNLVTNLRETDINVKDYFRKDVSGKLLHETFNGVRWSRCMSRAIIMAMTGCT